ncbi:hypothetical protein BH20ACI3_BH20ACI3_10130 [soil metagenome]
MVLSLIPNVADDIGDIRFTHGKRGVSILPSELVQRRKLFVDPLRRLAFKKLSYLAWRESWCAMIRAWM